MGGRTGGEGHLGRLVPLSDFPSFSLPLQPGVMEGRLAFINPL